jgi:hypothetical protein
VPPSSTLSGCAPSSPRGGWAARAVRRGGGGAGRIGLWQWDKGGGDGRAWQHYGYAVQWWLFACFAVFLWVKLVLDERDPSRLEDREAPTRRCRRWCSGRRRRRPRTTTTSWPPTTATWPGSPSRRRGTASGDGGDAALQRYRIIANVVGVVLVVFLLVAVPLRYLGGEPRMSETISPIHGFLYVVYLGVTVDLAAGRLVGRAHAARRARRAPCRSCPSSSSGG